MLRHVPNILTLINLTCGCIATVLAFNGFTMSASLFILAGAYFDFMDGLAARLLNAYSDMGKQLDSLADLITFGIAPAAILFTIMHGAVGPEIKVTESVILYFPFLITIFSALRLARFNVDESQTESFKGLATPACAILIASFPMLLFEFEPIRPILMDQNYLLIIILGLSLLMVAPIPMFSMKIKGFDIKKYAVQFIFIILSIVLVIVFQWLAWPMIILLYILISIIYSIVKLILK